MQHWMRMMFERQRGGYPFPLSASELVDAAWPGITGSGQLARSMAHLHRQQRAYYALDAKKTFYMESIPHVAIPAHGAIELPLYIATRADVLKWYQDVSVVEQILDMEKFKIQQIDQILRGDHRVWEQHWPEVANLVPTAHRCRPRWNAPSDRTMALVKKQLDRDIGRDTLDRLEEKLAMCLLMPENPNVSAWIVS